MRIFLLRRRHLVALLGVVLVLAIFAAVNAPAAVIASASTRQLPIYCVDRSDNLVSISFDAAWGNEDTQQLIDILDQYQVKATFFVVGDWVDKYPESVKALHDAGHEVMNHSNTHAHYNSLTAEEIIADVEACNDKIEAVTGVRPTLIRPPYGEYDDSVVSAIRSIGMEPIQWDVDSLDWNYQDRKQIADKVCREIENGDIVLMHDIFQSSQEAALDIIDRLTAEGWQFVTADELMVD